jgi:hypothetical protein
MFVENGRPLFRHGLGAMWIVAWTVSVMPGVSRSALQANEPLKIDNGSVQVGIDRDRGGAITWLSSTRYPKNMINLADPGRLIQQSYYAGERLDRTSAGQSKAWSPWPWNPIQGGGIGSWAHATQIRGENNVLFSETTPKLWDMPNEDAQALMRQWTEFEPMLANSVVTRCEFISLRAPRDAWGPARIAHQEIPACYFTRNFVTVKSYLGGGKWRQESQLPGPPWGKALPPQNAMACFTADGQGVAVFSPAATEPWNFGPHARGLSDDPNAGPCMHVAPIASVKLAPQCTFRYRYWLVLGDEAAIAESLDWLWGKYAEERAQLIER